MLKLFNRTNETRIKTALLLMLLSVSITIPAFADIQIIATHRGHDGLTTLTDRMLSLQIADSNGNNTRLNRTTDAYGIFAIPDKYQQATVRAYLRDEETGTIIAGCFSDFVLVIPAEKGKIAEVSLKGIDCK